MQETALLTDQVMSTPGAAYSPSKTTLQAGTAALQVHLKLTAGSATSPNARSSIKCYVVVSPFSVTAAAAANIFKIMATPVDIPTQSDQGVIGNASEVIPALGAYCYVWFEVPRFDTTAPSLSASLIELN